MGDLCASVRALWVAAEAAVAVTATLRAIPEGNADTARPLLKGPLSGEVPIPSAATAAAPEAVQPK